MTAVQSSLTRTSDTALAGGKPRSSYSIPSLRRLYLSRYGLLLLAGALLVVAVFLLAAWQSRTRMLGAAAVEVAQRTALLEAHMSKVFESNELVLGDIVRRVEGMSWEEIRDSPDISKMLSEREADMRDIVDVELLSPDGNVVSHSNRFPASTVDESGLDYFRFHRDSADDVTYLGEPVISHLSKVRSMTMSRKLKGPDGSFNGVVLLTIPVTYFSELLDSAMSKSDVAVLSRNDGTVIVAAPAPVAATELGPQAHALFRDGAFPASPGSYRLLDNAGVARTVALRNFANYPLAVAIGVDENKVLEPWRSSNLLYVSILGLAVTAFLVSASIARSRAVSLTESNVALRETTSRLLLSQDSERRKIARDLHDSTAQNLLGANVEIEIALRRNPALNAEARAALERCAALISRSEQELRTLSYLLHPPMLDESGLPNALELLVSGFEKRCGIEVELRVAPQLAIVRPSRHVELAVFRVVQEALSNIHRHSDATTARIRLVNPRGGSHSVLFLTVSDNGGGMIDAAAVGVGLASMRGRLQALGGTLEIASGAKGTTVTATVPG
jgi:signal transduction histidine kinase